MSRLAILLALLVATVPAFAMDQPKGTAYDTRIQYVNYNQDDVVEVNSYPGIATQIVFAPGEVVQDMSSGFSQGWQASTSANSVYLKPQSVKLSDNTIAEPTAGKWNTNLMVTTNRHVYSFLLVLHTAPASGKLVYNPKVAFRITFRYPGDEAAAAKLAAAKAATQAKLDTASKPVPANWKYSMQVGKKSESIAPTMAYDDGRFTYLRFPGNRDFPAAFVAADDGSESIVNSHIDPAHPDVLVVHRVARELVLRLGNEVVGVFNDAFDPYGKPATTGTTIKGVTRVIRGQDTGAEQ
ncbi:MULTISPECIES: P-type conjugative transfer protein VirB9 [unclassified Rhodanobacter]|uniref:P-type conjugative transfer protein VirB9 n=1 Tax=Rhodanobacter humi TaxID=1888173 RepID=A0ABV4AVF4_9GAMM